MPTQCFDALPPTDVVERCVEVYAAAFGQGPYHEPADQALELADRLDKYQHREGFLLPVVRDAAGTVRAFALAVVAHPGDWWRDRAAAALGEADAHEWLGTACLEVVHVAVDPEVQRHGYGRRLMTALESHTSAATGVLSCHPHATPAQQLYLAMGWQILTREFRTRPDQIGYWLMAKGLKSGG